MMKSVITDLFGSPRSFSWGSATSDPLGETSQMEANDAFGGADLGGTLPVDAWPGAD